MAIRKSTKVGFDPRRFDHVRNVWILFGGDDEEGLKVGDPIPRYPEASDGKTYNLPGAEKGDALIIAWIARPLPRLN